MAFSSNHQTKTNGYQMKTKRNADLLNIEEILVFLATRFLFAD